MHRRLGLALALLLTACSDTSARPPGADGGMVQGDAGVSSPIPIDALAEQSISALCQVLFRCPAPSGDTVVTRSFLGSEASCREHLGRAHPSGLGLLTEMIRDAKAGRTTYDPAAASACLARYTSSCSYLAADVDFSLLCAQAFVGSGAVGAPCNHSHECLPSLYCSGQDCPGSCQPRRAWGEACRSVRDCPVPSDPANYAVCGNGTCQQHVPGNAPPSPENGPCGVEPGATSNTVTSTSCATGLVCGRDRLCHRPIAVGAPCSNVNDPCASDAYCDTDAMPKVCRTIGKAGSGAACGADAWAFCDLSQRLWCGELTQQCAPSDGAMGSPCSRDMPAQATPCAAGLYCAGQSCQPRKANGEACDRSDDCLSAACDCENAACDRQVCLERGCSVRW